MGEVIEITGVYYSGSEALYASRQILHAVVVGNLVVSHLSINEARYPDRVFARLSKQQTVSENSTTYSSTDKVTHSEQKDAVNTDIIGTEEYDPRRDEVTRIFTDMEFTFNREWLLGNGLVEATKDSRMRATLASLKSAIIEFTKTDHDDEEGEEIAINVQKPALPDPKELNLTTTAKRSLMITALTKAPVKFADGTILTKGDVIDLKDVYAYFEGKLHKQNHPVFQVVKSLAEQFPELSSTTLQEIRKRLIDTVAFEEIRDLYTRTVSKVRKASRQSADTA
ncbi:MAG: hypothetical protein M3Q14_04130 [bacterium]|nr:hypothetical protein [bacterium]